MTGLLQQLRDLHNGLVAGGGIHQHHHGEILLQNGLADVQNVDAVLGQQGADGGSDAHLVPADDSDDGFIEDFLSTVNLRNTERRGGESRCAAGRRQALLLSSARPE
mgnify:CR=1 FL=1